ncbi:VOC family protein [uncultured Roseibium sp.]|uniref:VOC family protein n=1 Tax=uncultured Roseibium sp. TaxID=1936171 RepID=UPI0026394295|nr:VOC family protein [uncultured Roseibium sp.]
MTINDRSGLRAIRSIDYVIVLCDDWKKMRAFFIDIFNFEIEQEEEGHFIAFRVGTLFLALRPRGRAYDGPRKSDGSAGIQLSFRVPPADVDLAYQALTDKGIDVIEPPTNQDFPHRTLFFRDPENNVIEIFADIHPRDTLPASSGLHRVVTGA